MEKKTLPVANQVSSKPCRRLQLYGSDQQAGHQLELRHQMTAVKVMIFTYKSGQVVQEIHFAWRNILPEIHSREVMVPEVGLMFRSNPKDRIHMEDPLKEVPEVSVSSEAVTTDNYVRVILLNKIESTKMVINL